jgi:uncharacterized protein YdeI (YjbR/CyaY-like superfamily)
MQNSFLPQNVDQYLAVGCMRCKFGGTPKCKVNFWIEELLALRAIVLETGLKEEVKWGFPVYTQQNRNIVTINALKGSANIGFFKGVFLKDAFKILKQQGNIQSARIIPFKSTEEILKHKEILIGYILESIEIEKKGLKVELKKRIESFPDELVQAFEEDHSFKDAFYRLTPGRRRGYVLYFSQAKQVQTRIARIQKYKVQIFNGVGLNDVSK